MPIAGSPCWEAAVGVFMTLKIHPTTGSPRITVPIQKQFR